MTDESTPDPTPPSSTGIASSAHDPLPVTPPTSAASAPGPQRKTAEERKEALARAIHSQVAQGARVESQGDFQAILVKGHRPNHVLHLILGFVTLGFWWLVWIALAVLGGEKRMSISVDEWGHTNIQKL